MPEEVIEICGQEYDESMGCEPMVLFWYAEEGSDVVEGQDLCEIESAKAVVVITAPATGKLTEILVKETESVASGQLLARLQPASA